MQMKKVSVVVPCYNAGMYLDKCIGQLLRQTIGVENMEIILVDDASTDHGETRRKIMEYEHRYPNTVMAVFLEQNLRQGGARNVGVSCAGGEYLCFCDADDWLLEEALEHSYLAAKKYDADVVEFRGENVTERDAVVELKKGDGDRLKELDTEEKKKEFLLEVTEQITYGSQQKLYRLSMIHEHQIAFAEHLMFEEPSFVVPVRLYERRHYFLDEKLYVWYLSSGSTMRSSWEEKHRWDNLRVWLSLIKDLSARGLLERYAEELEYQFWSWGLGLSLMMLLQKGCILTKEELKLYVDITLQLFPDVRENKYIGYAATAWDYMLLNILDMELTDEQAGLVNQLLKDCM